MCNLLWSNSSSCSMQAAQLSDDGDLDACAEAGWTTSPKSIPSSERINSRFLFMNSWTALGWWDEYGMNMGWIWMNGGLIWLIWIDIWIDDVWDGWWVMTLQAINNPAPISSQGPGSAAETIWDRGRTRALAESPETIWGIPPVEIQQIMEFGFTGTPLVWLIGYV
jgi:hypothetical protein